jgi:hypothetical protein
VLPGSVLESPRGFIVMEPATVSLVMLSIAVLWLAVLSLVALLGCQKLAEPTSGASYFHSRH